MTGKRAACTKIEILLVDDNPGDIRLTREALSEENLCHELRVVRSGSEALAMLRHNGRDEEAPLPDLILLDVNLPELTGLEFLAEIKADKRLGRIPVVMLSTSAAEKDICRAYDGHANCYVVKPAELEEFIGVMKSLVNFWVSVASLPER